MSYFKNVSLDTDNAAGDAFGRVRVSEPNTIFDSKLIFSPQPLFWDDQEVSGSGTGSTHSTDTASVTLTVGNTTAGKRVRQTFRRFNYQPGKSMYILATGVLCKSGGGTGITKRMGYFDDNNGLFIEDDEGTINVVRRTNVTGSPVDNKVAQSSWNIDPMDGTGPSGVTLDFTKTQIFAIDFEWLGVGRVRFGFNVDGVTYYCHEFLNANNLNEVYMSTPNLPLREEIENDGTGVASSLQCICNSVISEGGNDDNGIVRRFSTSGTHVDANTENLVYAIVGIRLKTGYIGTAIRNLKAGIAITTTSEKAEWILKFNPTVAGTFTYNDVSNSAIQAATGDSTNTVTGGIDIDGDFVFSGNAASGSGAQSTSLNNALVLGSAIDGTRDEIVLCCRPIAGAANLDIEGGITWRELE